MTPIIYPLAAAFALASADITVARLAAQHDQALHCEDEPTRPQRMAKAIARKVKPLSTGPIAKARKAQPEPCQPKVKPAVKGAVQEAPAPAAPRAEVPAPASSPAVASPAPAAPPAAHQQAPERYVLTGYASAPVVTGWGLVVLPVPVYVDRWQPAPEAFAFPPGSTKAWDVPGAFAFPPGSTGAGSVPSPGSLALIAVGALVAVWAAHRGRK